MTAIIFLLIVFLVVGGGIRFWLWTRARTEPDPTTVDMAEFWSRIKEKRAKPPAPLGALDKALVQWKKANPDQVAEITEAAAVRLGLSPVIAEDALPEPGLKGSHTKKLLTSSWLRPWTRPWKSQWNAGDGYARSTTVPVEYQMASNYAAGWHQNVTGAASPMIGVPIGRNLSDGRDVGFDVLSWLHQKLITTPSAFVLSTPGKGKSTLLRQLNMGHIAMGHTAIVPNDRKNEYSAMVAGVGGQVIRLGHGQGHLNPLDPGALGSIVPQLRAKRDELISEANELMEKVVSTAVDAKIQGAGDIRKIASVDADDKLSDAAKADAKVTLLVDASERTGIATDAMDQVSAEYRDKAAERDKVTSLVTQAIERTVAAQLRMVKSLVSIARKAPMEPLEDTAVREAINVLYSDEEAWETPPTIEDLISALKEGSDELKEYVVARNDEEYWQLIAPLLRSLHAILRGGTGEIFAGQTTERINIDAPAICIDMSSFTEDDSDPDTEAAVMMACWSTCLGAVTAAEMMHQAGLRKQRLYTLTIDELWSALAAAPQMTMQVDSMLRLLRTLGMGVYLCTHGTQDLNSLPTPEDRIRAMGFIDRSGVVICGGLSGSELENLGEYIPFNDREAAEIVNWDQGEGLPRTRGDAAGRLSPGIGRFMMKISKSNKPGVAFQTIKSETENEYELHETNARFFEAWAEVDARAAGDAARAAGVELDSEDNTTSSTASYAGSGASHNV